MPLIAALLALLILGSAAHARDPARRGRTLLKEFCARCHAIGKDRATQVGRTVLETIAPGVSTAEQFQASGAEQYQASVADGG